MELLTNQILAGIATGAIYACMALALVMIYQAIDHLNFAQGELSMFSSFIGWQLLHWGYPYWAAFVLTICISFLGGVAIERSLFRPLAKASVLAQVAAFIALFAIVNSVAGLTWDWSIKEFPTPFGTAPFLGSRLISNHQVGMIGTTLLLVAFLFIFFRYSLVGLAMRAAAGLPESAKLVGINVAWMISLGWGMAAAIGAVAGMLIAPAVFLEPNMMGGILVYGFAAAVLGGLTSPVGAVVGGFLVGVFENLVATYVPGIGTELKLPVALAVIVAVLVFRPGGLFGRAITSATGLVSQLEGMAPGGVSSERSPARRRLGLLAFAAALALIPLFAKNFVTFQMTMLLVYALAILALNVLTGASGQLSLGSSAFFGAGAYIAALVLQEMGPGSYLFALLAATLICFPLGFFFALPTLRFNGVYLALATFSLAVAMPQVLKLSFLEQWTGGVQGIVVMKPEAPEFLSRLGLSVSGDSWFYYVTFTVFVAFYVATTRLLASRSGRALMAIRDNEVAASAMGVNVALFKTLAFGVSAAVTGLAGALGAIAVGFVAPDSYTVRLSIALFLGMVVGGAGWLPGSLAGAAFIVFVPHFAENISKGLSGAVFGALLLLVIYNWPNGAREIALLLCRGRISRQPHQSLPADRARGVA